MFDWMLPEDHAITILKKDHDEVKQLFEDFEKAKTSTAKEDILRRAVTALKAHAVLEEEIFYPAVRKHVGKKTMNEADEEHHVAKVLIAELDQPGQARGDHREAKFTVLAENVRHHIKEEENEMLPKAKELSIDFEALGKKMKARKNALLTKGFPTDAEHVMVGRVGGRTDSPAAIAHQKSRPRKRKAARRGSVNPRAKRRTHR